MLVLAAVPEVQLQRLRRAAGVRFTFMRAESWSEVLAGIRARPVELAVLDPTLAGEPRAQELERLRLLFPSLPLILYTALTPQLAAVLLALGQRGIRHVIFLRYDDHPEHLREVLEREATGAASRRLLDQLADRLSPLPTELRWVLEEALRTPEEVQTVGRLAARARVDRRTCERWFTRVGLPTPRHFLAGPRLHDRRCCGPAGLRPGQDAAAARADLPRPHRRGDALVAEPRRSPGHCGAAVPCAGCAVERRRLMTTGPQARYAVTVLVVDDEAPLRRVLERALSRDGYRVLSVASAEEAYDLLSREQPDALLLDIHLPTMSGLSLYLAIKARWPQLQGRVAIMTGDAEAEEVGAWLEHNPCALIRKPFDLAQVTGWVASVLRWHREQLGNG